MKEWLRANGGPPAVALVGLALVGFTTVYAWVLVGIGLLWFLWQVSPWEIRRKDSVQPPASGELTSDENPQPLGITGMTPAELEGLRHEQERELSKRQKMLRRQDALLRSLRHEYEQTTSPLPPNWEFGTVPIPKEWVERRLAEMGETFSRDVYWGLPQHEGGSGP